MSTLMNTLEPSYGRPSADAINKIAEEHRWITEPLFRASEAVKQMPFFEWIQVIQSPADFGVGAKQLFYHSATFPKVLGLMMGILPHSENHMMSFYAHHAHGEANHHELLMTWMLKHGILNHRDDIQAVILTTETSACINLAYQLAIEQDRAKWLVTINSAIERCANDFFKVVAPKMRLIGAGDVYFDIHVEADEHHSVMGLQYLPEELSPTRQRQLIAKALEGVSTWAAMLHSWIGIDLHPKFDLDGRLYAPR